MQNRINRLEGLVLSLMHNGGNTEGAAALADDTGRSGSQSFTDGTSSARNTRDDDAAPIDEDSDVDEGLATSLGVLKVDIDNGKSMYIGQEHWHTLLSDIAEVKNYFTSHKKELETGYERVRNSKPMAAREGPTLLVGAPPASEVELRAELPPKSSVLTLCSRYFNSMDNAVNIIHGPTFQQQLRAYWQDPSKTSIMWLGLLYSVLTLAMLSYHKVGDEPPEWRGRTLEMASDFRMRTVQCLIKADYTKPVEHTIETMILYSFGEYSARWDAELGLWMIVSLITRLAYRMGYHRDAKWFPSITPFQAEMRRRTWALVRMSDIIFSHQVSLPSMIYEHDCDTQLPNNLFDEDFHPDMKELPPSRPSTQPTPVSYLIAKARLCNELGNILQTTNGIGKHVSYDEIIRFDAKLRQIMQDLPPHLKLKPLDDTHDPVTLIIARFNIEILSQKILCLLHRKYLPRARQNTRYAHSRRCAVEASLRALEHLSTLNRESQSNGRLRSVGWYIKSIATKDFVLPAMLIILDLHYDNMAAQAGSSSETEGNFLWTPEQRQQMISALQEAASIWKNQTETSMEAYKANKIVEIMLQKIDSPSQGGSRGPEETQAPFSSPFAMGTDPSMATLSQAFASPLGSMPESSMGMKPLPFDDSANLFNMDWGMSPSAVMNLGTGSGIGGAASPLSSFANGSGMAPELTGDFDWGAFENYAQTTNWGADTSFQMYGAGAQDSSPEQNMNLQ